MLKDKQLNQKGATNRGNNSNAIQPSNARNQQQLRPVAQPRPSVGVPTQGGEGGSF